MSDVSWLRFESEPESESDLAFEYKVETEFALLVFQ